MARFYARNDISDSKLSRGGIPHEPLPRVLQLATQLADPAGRDAELSGSITRGLTGGERLGDAALTCRQHTHPVTHIDPAGSDALLKLAICARNILAVHRRGRLPANPHTPDAVQGEHARIRQDFPATFDQSDEHDERSGNYLSRGFLLRLWVEVAEVLAGNAGNRMVYVRG